MARNMNNIIYIKGEGKYENIDCLENAVAYANKLNNGLFGVKSIYPPTPAATIMQMNTVFRAYDIEDQKLWSVLISPDPSCMFDTTQLMMLASRIADYWDGHQCFYGIHTDTGKKHIHMYISIVNTRNGQLITENDMYRSFMKYAHEQVRNFLSEIVFDNLDHNNCASNLLI
ncbi:hypothetical protein M2146_000352 [Lachnospiraceae bacterium PF1-22]|uniref:relaxase/mobilization nuclease domain-containing protein n=1 Tax=Ohessyouella blattaphilus TaxID=2949333 RepID=UPI003E27D3B6